MCRFESGGICVGRGNVLGEWDGKNLRRVRNTCRVTNTAAEQDGDEHDVLRGEMTHLTTMFLQMQAVLESWQSSVRCGVGAMRVS